MDRGPVRPIVVAVDDTGPADAAVEWAAAEAATRQRPLRVVHALAAPRSVDPSAVSVVVAQVAAERVRADEIASRAVSCAMGIAPDLDVTVRLVEGTAASVLLREARSAGGLVLGVGERWTARRLFGDSVSATVATRANCPVVLVPDKQPPPGRPEVVLGLDNGAAGLPALGFAFRAAWHRGVPLTVVHASWRAHERIGPAELSLAAFGDLLDDSVTAQALLRAQRQFPSVDVRTRLVEGDAAAALAALSTGATLLVLGSAGRRRIGRPAVSVGRRLLTAATCPVAIVRSEPTS
jgi:nucleotide-binding universal stress UspA family protein